MDIEEESIIFLEHHMDKSFPNVTEMILHMEWFEEKNFLRPYAIMKSNLILLFPPFYPKSEIKS
tara:strand:+ start:227 stop:418 length:192 start_codon:yes stop_codon:yes gene_type:complete